MIVRHIICMNYQPTFLDTRQHMQGSLKELLFLETSYSRLNLRHHTNSYQHFFWFTPPPSLNSEIRLLGEPLGLRGKEMVFLDGGGSQN